MVEHKEKLSSIRIKTLREKKGLNMKEAAVQLQLPYTTYRNYEQGLREPNSETLIQIANFYNTSIDYLLGRSDKQTDETNNTIFDIEGIMSIKTKRFPLLGNIACGEPIYADEDRESYIMAGTDIKADFCLKAKGDSMINARIMDGDIVFIHKQEMVDDGEIAAVIIDDEATLKRVYYDKEAGILQLVAENPKYKTMRFSGEELNHIRILGKAIAFQSDVR